VKFLISKRRLVLIVAAVLLVLFVFRPGANGLRKRIVSSVGMALGRRVEVQWVKLRILPQPGFDLENFIVYDDPTFGAEPMLRAEEVTATLRLRSLIRGRLEIGRLDLKEPSFNLVRGEDGHWNIEALLDRAAHTPAAPTSHVRPEHRPVFPYIEADNGRINFKIGPEKKSYALTDADFALWLESENEWGMRLAARPVRTDFNLSDTGILQVEGTWERSGSLRETPLKFRVNWERAQLGQFSKLISGKDKGWRGGVTLSSTLSGTPADLTLTARGTVDDFRRFDIVSSDTLRLAAECSAHYTSIEHSVSNIVCHAPLEQGTLILAGNIQSPTGPRSYDLELLAQDIPIQPLVTLARHSKKDLPDDLTGKGLLNASVTMKTSGDAKAMGTMWTGDGAIEDLRLASSGTEAVLKAEEIPFVVSSASVDDLPGRPKANRDKREFFRVNFGPFAVDWGGTSLPSVTGWAATSGYSVLVQGESQVSRVLAAGRTMGLSVPSINADGTAKLHLEVAGNWTSFAAPEMSGTAQLHSVRTEMRGMGQVEIRSANLLLTKDSVQLQSLSAVAGGTHWNGAVTLPRTCETQPCPTQVDLRADVIFVDRLNSWLHPQPRKQPWYRVLSGSKPQGTSLLKTLNAVGTIAAGRVVFRGVEATDVLAQLKLSDGKLDLKDVSGNLLGGKHVGTWQADLRTTPPRFSGTGNFRQISMKELAQAMDDEWITGTGNGTYRFTSAGGNGNEAVQAASATLDFEVQNGLLSHISLATPASPLRIRRCTGQLVLNNGQFKIEQSKLETADGVYRVSGTATMGQKLDVKLARGVSRGFNITGTLAAPRVSPFSSPETQAALKP
jgi:AsmA family/AsmA-like C-terminal region